MHETTLEWSTELVEEHTLGTNDCVMLTLGDGSTLEGSTNHRVFTTCGWAELQNLVRNMSLMPHGLIVRKIEVTGSKTVVKMTVANAHTYVSGGVLSHNVKPVLLTAWL